MRRLGAIVRMAGSDWPATETSVSSNAVGDGRVSASRKSRRRSTIRTGDRSAGAHAAIVRPSEASAADAARIDQRTNPTGIRG